MQLFSNDLGVDLGTSNVLIYADGKGLVVRECFRLLASLPYMSIETGNAAPRFISLAPGQTHTLYQKISVRHM